MNCNCITFSFVAVIKQKVIFNKTKDNSRAVRTKLHHFVVMAYSYFIRCESFPGQQDENDVTCSYNSGCLMKYEY